MSPPTRALVDLPPAPLQVRERGRYEVLAEHGRGGLGRVSRARDNQLGREVAIKELIKRGDAREIRFVREALITARLEHPGIVPVHEAGCWADGTPFYAMKLVSGRPLKELIEERTTVEARLGLLPHVIAVADAIAYAHGRRIIHRDLKPGNVIVGEFGETVVIDWGLAKDLSQADEQALDHGPYRTLASDDLTITGSVLGTPAYMAPEQARGEAVDERGDVFAIGAILWEVCTRTRVPPDPHRRNRLLRREGIDPDLATIVGKAIAPDPGDRYRDAAALATDLKAFHAGARIAARDYSLFALLAHWTRRRRRLAISGAAIAAVALVGIIWFVRNIAAERDRADASAIEAHAQQRRAEQSADAITLQHAELQLRSDPTAAIATLAGYHGTDASQLRRLRAEAIGRGVASATLEPHAVRIWHLATTATGGIISVAGDRTVQLTRAGKSITLATKLVMPPTVAYARGADVLVYAPVASGIVVVSLATGATTRIETPTPSASDILPDGSRYAAVTKFNTVTVWSLGPAPSVIHQASVPGARDVEFITRDRIAVMEGAGLRAIWLDGARAPQIASLSVRSFDAAADRIAAGGHDGSVALFSPELAPLARISVCRMPVTVTLVPNSDLIAFACEEARAGVVRHDRATGTLVVVDTFATTERAYGLAADEAGKLVVVSDDSSLFYVYDIETRLVTRYEGQPAQISAVAAPAAGFDHITVGDTNGNLRIWEPPPRAAHKLFQGQRAVFGVAFSPDGKSIATAHADGTVRMIRIADGAITELTGQATAALRVQFSGDGQSVLSFSGDGTARVWRADGALLRVFADHGRAVHSAAFIESGRRVVSVGDDGRVLAWSPGGTDATVLHTRPLPVTGLEVRGGTGHVVVSDVEGAILDVALDGAARPVRSGDGATVSLLRASPDGRLLATATDVGDVAVYDTSDWRTIRTMKLGGGVRQIRFDPRNRDLMIASQDGRVHAVALGPARVRFADVPILARNLEYSADGETLAIVCPNGGSWFYDIAGDTWAYAVDHASEVFNGAFSPDGALFASGDRRGLVTIRNVAATLAAARAQP